MFDISDMSNLTLSDLIPDSNLSESQLDLVLRSLECKLLKIPDRIKNSNPSLDFSGGDLESVITDIDEITTEIYELVMCIRECLPLKGGDV